jgi:2-aminophenol/2-amino-5-chlorophenol 1,6-dioxygenase alpha subunit
MSAALGLVVPALPHVLLVPERNPHWSALRRGYAEAAAQIEQSGADLLVLYSTRWPSVIGHQIQADPEPVWTHVDQDWHALGSISYRLRMDAAFAQAYQQAATARGLHARTVAYQGFPIDTGSIVALSLLNPGNRLPATIVSCNMYADRAETLVLGKAARDAVEAGGRKAVFVAVTALSNRVHPRPVPDAQDHISSLQDDEWNRKFLEILGEGRLEDVAQLARTFTVQAHADSKMKAIWWLAAAMGQDNAYAATVHAYGPLQGTGAAVVSLRRADRAAADHEFDEEDVERFVGDRKVLSAAGGGGR